MSWATRFRIRQYVQESLWLLPLLGVVLGLILGVVDTQVGESIHVPASWTFSPSTATTALSAIIGAMAALTGFVVTVTILAVQIVVVTFSARYMRAWYRDPMLKAVLAIFLGTLVFSFSLLRRVGDNSVPNLGVMFSGLLVVVSLLLFVVFLNRYLRALRPVAVARDVADNINRDFRRLAAVMTEVPDVFAGPFEPNGERPMLIAHSAAPGAIQAIDLEGLVGLARQHDCLLALEHCVGDSVPSGAALVKVYGGQLGSTDERTLQGMVALGVERTVAQDPAFAIRIMVDIAAKALSPGINDPTTAVQVLDELEEVLRVIGTTDLGNHRWPATGGPQRGVVIPTRSWADYLALSVTEIREFGATSIQVVRRLRAMLEQLRREVPPERRPAVTDELDRLDATVADAFGQSVDLDRALVADQQGLGGSINPPRERALAH